MTPPARIKGQAEGALVLDLLRERRATLGQEALSATLVQRRALLQRGALIGLILLGSPCPLYTSDAPDQLCSVGTCGRCHSLT